MLNKETSNQKYEIEHIEPHREFECWEFEDVDILVNFPDKNLLIPTNKKTVLGAFLKQFNDNLEYRNRINKVTSIKPIPYFISFAVTTLLAIVFLIIIYYASSKNIILLNPFIALFGFFASFGLALTSIVGILNWGKRP